MNESEAEDEIKNALVRVKCEQWYIEKERRPLARHEEQKREERVRGVFWDDELCKGSNEKKASFAATEDAERTWLSLLHKSIGLM